MTNFYENERKNASDFRLEVFGLSAAGHRRTTNEDAFLVAEFGRSARLVAVADGFSGAFGEEASRLAVGELQRRMQMPSAATGVGERLRMTFEIISRKIVRHFQTIHHSQSGGTTLTAAFVQDGDVYLAHVGNTRAYLARAGEMRLLTRDQTFAQILLDTGVEPGAAARKTLLQAIGVECALEPSLVRARMLPGDSLLLCSDGFSNCLADAEILRVLNENPALEAAVSRLVEAADERDGADNITVVLARAFRAATTAATAATAERGFQPVGVEPPRALRMAA